MFQTLSLNYQEWKSYTKTIFQEPIKNEFCPFLSTTLSTRIGSDSHNAEIYLYKPPLCRVTLAIKIIPLISGFDKYIQNEIMITQHLSNTKLVYYPKIYEYGKCEVSQFHLQSKFKNQKYVYYIVMECLYKDLLQKINSTKNLKQLIHQVLLELIDIIYDLNYNQGICHDDLHIKNVMFRKYKDHTYDIVLVDFGSSRIFDKNHDQFSDLINIYKSINNYYNISNIIDKINLQNDYKIKNIKSIVNKYIM
jgi:hypothetical protein